MSKFYGSMVTAVEDGGTIVDKIKSYDNYEEMVNDSNSGKYGICKDTNTVWHKTDNGWVVGFANIERDDDYTAFEVFAHDYVIPVGECEELGGYVNSKVPASMTHSFIIRSNFNQTDIDVVIDWGDGTIKKLSDITPSSNYRYTVSHTYNVNGKYIVKVFGKKYFAFLHGTTGTNILCRIFDYDLPVASHLTNFSSFARATNHLLHVDVSRCENFTKNFSNIALLFATCQNLISAKGFNVIRNKRNISYGQVFYNNHALKETDFLFSHNLGGIAGTFYKCMNLEFDVASVFTYFNQDNYQTIDCNNLFSNCSKMHGIIPANKLWNNKKINWTNTIDVFTGCSEEIRAQAPVSWGGTASDDIIEKSDAEKIAELTARLEALENS